MTNPSASPEPNDSLLVTPGKESAASARGQNDADGDKEKNPSPYVGANSTNPPSISELTIIIAKMIVPNNSGNEVISKANADLEVIFTKNGIVEYSDLAFVNWEKDVLPNIVKSAEFPLLSVVTYQRKLQYIFEYAKLGMELDNTSTVNNIRKMVEQANQKAQLPTTLESPAITNKQTLKTDVPELPTWNGSPETFFPFKDKATTRLGQSGLLKFVTDKNEAKKSPEIAQAIFFALHNAISHGSAVHYGRQMIEKEVYDPIQLWSDLSSKFETPANTAGYLLRQIQALFDLRLDVTISPSQFVSDFKSALLKLNAYSAKITQDEATLRALLMRAIQDDDFDQTREYILNNPTCSHADILDHISSREVGLNIKDAGDGRQTIQARRAKSVQFKEESKTDHAPWKIPNIPNSWKNALRKGFFQHILEWRKCAHGSTISPHKLFEKFDVVVEHNNRKRSAQSPNGSRRNRRAKLDDTQTIQGTPEESDLGSDNTKNTGQSEFGERLILLAKDRS